MSRIIISLVNDRHRYESELAEPEIYAIGYVTVAWAMLEHLLLASTIELTDKANIPLPDDALALSFKKRCRAWRAVIKATVENEKERTKLIRLANRIGNAERTRNRITHGVWDWDPAKPDKLKGQSYRVPYEYEEPFDLNKLIKLGERVGEINFQLALPRGKDQAWEEMAQAAAQRGGFVSREFALRLAGKEIVNPHLPLPTPPKHKKSRSTSRD